MAQSFTTDVTQWQESDEIKREDSAFDFAISDEVGYNIVHFKNGHIKTKNFDSENFFAIEGSKIIIK